MILDFAKMETKEMEHFKGGEKFLKAKMLTDDLNKVMLSTLVPGASVGLHTHEDSSEIIYILEGTGKVLYDGEWSELHPGLCHYCPKGHSHSVVNDSDKDLTFFAVVPNQ
ncbi:cupin domain-containing protein [Pseudoflavonifractor sp. MSJ-37]|uniref:cupin domain-containing protein n=1 Tax=Pseudoflavonifractor sp. MSJ-37 TaxID=2841531 RepID=UPI001C0F9AA5|nr:cupin domain-containing protein [Pseudoflavonifractor sp. MSJ-37]MBU5435454.1 cupin domain-containing protein [Pseudoflavonifractor sp. MSJ-37]